MRSYPTKITVRGSLILWLLFLLAHQHFRIIVLLCNCKLALHQVHHASGMNLFYLAPSLSPLPLSLSPSPTLIPSLPLPLSPLPLSLSPLSPSPLLLFSPDHLSWEDGGRGDTPPWFPGSSVPHLQGRLLWTSLIPPHPLPLLLSRLQGTDNTAWQEFFRGLLLSCPVRGLTSLLDIQERTVLYSVKVGSKQQRKLSHTFCLACVYLLTKVHRKLWQID